MDNAGRVGKYKNLTINLAIIILALIISYNIYKGNLSALESLKAKISEEEKKISELSKIDKMEKKDRRLQRITR